MLGVAVVFVSHEREASVRSLICIFATLKLREEAGETEYGDWRLPVPKKMKSYLHSTRNMPLAGLNRSILEFVKSRLPLQPQLKEIDSGKKENLPC